MKKTIKIQLALILLLFVYPVKAKGVKLSIAQIKPNKIKLCIKNETDKSYYLIWNEKFFSVKITSKNSKGKNEKITEQLKGRHYLCKGEKEFEWFMFLAPKTEVSLPVLLIKGKSKKIPEGFLYIEIPDKACTIQIKYKAENLEEYYEKWFKMYKSFYYHDWNPVLKLKSNKLKLGE